MLCELYDVVLVVKLLRKQSVFGCFFFQAEDGIRDLVRSRGLGDVYKRQNCHRVMIRPEEKLLDG